MGRELQKKKRRSGRMPVRQSNKTKKILNPRGNNIIADNWDKKATMSQNYRRLGLMSRLRAPTGGVEGRLDQPSVAALQAAHSAADAASSSSSSSRNPFAIDPIEKAVITEARVERDAAGKIVRVIRADANPLRDPLRHLDDDDDDDDDQVVTELEGGGYVKNRKRREEHEEWGGIVDVDEATTDVVRELVEQARNPAPRKARHLSEREAEWLTRLVARHGDDTRAMARDVKLNPMQQTAADIARRLKKLNA